MTEFEGFNKFKEEWTPEAIAIARRNCSADSFAKLIYEEQAKYRGWNHEGYCRLIIAHFLSNLVDGLPTDLSPSRGRGE